MEPGPGDPVHEPSEPGRNVAVNQSQGTETTISIEQLRSLIEDEFYHACKTHFHMVGKGRRPDLPEMPTLTHRVLIQMYFLKEGVNGSFRELKAWLEKLEPSMCHVTESRLAHRVTTVLKSCLKMTQDQVLPFLSEMIDFHAAPPALAALHLNRLHLMNIEPYNHLPIHEITNSVVIALEHFKNSERDFKVCTHKWLKVLSMQCSQLSDSVLKSKVQACLKKYKALSNKKKVNDLELFLSQKFPDESTIPAPQETVAQVCSQCSEWKNAVRQKEDLLKTLEEENSALRRRNTNLETELETKTEILKELQKERYDLMHELDASKGKLTSMKREFKKTSDANEQLKEEVKEITNTKLYYKRNIECNKENEQLKLDITEVERKNATLTERLNSEQMSNQNLRQKIKNEQHMKSKFKKERDAMKDQIERCMYALNTLEDDKEITLKEKCNAFSSNVRELYMSLQGETNMVPGQTSKAVQLVAKHIFNKEIPLQALPCRRTSLNFMDEANHIAKQQIVETIRDSEHFTFASDGTSRQKRHYMEHHIILDSGGTLSIGFSEVPDDKADTLLKKSLDLIEELSETYCEAEGEAVKDEVFADIMSKMMCLMSDRAANMKLFNKKMLEYKRGLLGSDAAIEFLHCNAHFLIALADATEKAVKIQESSLDEKLGRDKHSIFSRFSSSTETAACRLIRTASDVFGPRGDEKNGCREEWLAHCDINKIKSQFTTYRSNRFNNLFDNALAILFHKDVCLHFLQNCASHSNLKLQSVCHDLGDQKVLSIIAGIALFSTYLATPYWKLMNSRTSYGQFPNHVKVMNAALKRWADKDFEIEDLFSETPLFGKDFALQSQVAVSFWQSELCDKDLTSSIFKEISKTSQEALERQLSDFLPGGVYGGDIPDDVQKLLDTCPLTNLIGERLFGDLDYNMVKRRTASTYLHSTINMWKHNHTSDYLNSKSPVARRKIMESAKKYGKQLKIKHKAAVKDTREAIKQRLQANERQKMEKQLQDKERQAALLTDLLNQGGLSNTKEDLDRLMSGPQPLQKLKVEMRFRKYYMNASDLRLTGSLQTLYASLCSHLEFDYHFDRTSERPRKRRKPAPEEEEESKQSDRAGNEEEDELEEIE